MHKHLCLQTKYYSGFEVFTAVVMKLNGLHGVISQKMILFKIRYDNMVQFLCPVYQIAHSILSHH
jgi:hypothetical protein